MPVTKCLATNFPCDSLRLDKSSSDSLTLDKRGSDTLIVVLTFLLANMFSESIINCKVSCRWALVELSYFCHWYRV